MLMTDRLLREESDPLARRELLAAAVDDVYATVLRQAYFVLFEIEAHDAIRAGRSTDELSELYMAKLREQFGDSVEIGPEFRYEWLSIPHIYQTPFYCYAYSFGQLLVLALYRRFQEEGEAFKPGYLRLLSYGGSARPEQILAEVGIDMTDRTLLAGGLRPRARAHRRAGGDEALKRIALLLRPVDRTGRTVHNRGEDDERQRSFSELPDWPPRRCSRRGSPPAGRRAADLWLHVDVHGDKGGERRRSTCRCR